MSARPWYKRFGADFVFGTTGMTLEERGAYSIIIDLIHDRGKPVPDEPRFMAGILGVSTRKWNSLRASLIDHGKIYERDGFLSNERCDRDLAEYHEQVRKQAESGAKGGRKRAENALNSERNDGEPPKKSNENNETTQGPLKPTRSQKPDKKGEAPLNLPKKSKRTEPRTALPDDWVIPDKWRSDARKAGLNDDAEIDRQSRKFANYHWSRGNRMARWRSAWATWLGNLDDFSPQAKYGGPRSRAGRDTDPYLDAARDFIAGDAAGRSAGGTGETGGLVPLPQDGSDGSAEGSLGNVIELQPVRSGGVLRRDDGASEPVQGFTGEGAGADQCVFASAFKLPGGGG